MWLTPGDRGPWCPAEPRRKAGDPRTRRLHRRVAPPVRSWLWSSSTVRRSPVCAAAAGSSAGSLSAWRSRPAGGRTRSNTPNRALGAGRRSRAGS